MPKSPRWRKMRGAEGVSGGWGALITRRACEGAPCQSPMSVMCVLCAGVFIGVVYHSCGERGSRGGGKNFKKF